MKTTLLKAVVCVTLVFASVLNADLKAQDKFITNDVMTGELVTSKIIYRHDGTLYRYMKYDFKYDNENRVIEKEAFKWDTRKEAWMPYYKINLTYNADQVVLNYAKWNAKKKVYDEAQEKSIYEMDNMNTPVAYQSFKRNSGSEEWRIVYNNELVYVQDLRADLK